MLRILVFLSLFVLPTIAPAQDNRGPLGQSMASEQTSTSIPDAPGPQPNERKTHDPQFESLYWAGFFCGAGATQSSATTPLIGCGVGISLFPFTFIEGGGIIDPTKSRGPGYFSVDGKIPLTIHGPLYVPNVIVGYTRFAKTADAKSANALDYGLAFDTPSLSHEKSAEPTYLRIELRDYYTFATPNQHNVMLRIGWMIGLHD